MRSLLISDLHGSFMQSLLEDAQKAGIERLVCLGDYDQPGLLKSILKLKINKIVIIGNHDYGFCKDLQVISDDLSREIDYYELWYNSPEKDLVIKASEKPIIEEDFVLGVKVCEVIDGRKIAYVHVALCSSPDFGREDIEDQLSTRLLYHGNRINLFSNFRRMNKEGIDILFRGHDHQQSVISQPKDGLFKRDEGANRYEGIKFEDTRRYIVSVGKLTHGSYAVYDSSKQTVRFGTLT